MEVTMCGKVCSSLDLEAHVKAYLSQVNLISEDLELHCWLFPTTFKGPTLEWYHCLEIPSTHLMPFVSGSQLDLFIANRWSYVQSHFNTSLKEIPRP